jgi:hypothetical protein
MKKIITSSALLLSFSFLLVFSAPQAHADVWGTTMAATIMKQAMEKIYDQIQGVLLGSLKVAAVQLLNSQINQLVGGSSGQALFITDYNSFLYQTPRQKTNLYMNDFFTLSTRGKSSSSNYISAGDVSSGLGGNYTQYLVSMAKQATVNSGTTTIQYDLDSYASSPSTMFSEGNWRGFNAFFSNPANNPYGYTLLAENAYQKKLAENQKTAEVQAQSSGGFLPVQSNGKVIAPAGSIEAITTRVQNMGNDIIANASNPAEFLSGVVTSTVNQTINRLVQQGIGQVQSSIQREINNVSSQTSTSLKSSVSTSGPAALLSY